MNLSLAVDRQQDCILAQPSELMSLLLTLLDTEFGSGLISSDLAPQWKLGDVLFIVSKIT